MFVIVKFTRQFDGHSYSGPSCNMAGLEVGASYHTIEDAKDACEKLQKVNPVGWEVYDRYGVLSYSTVENIS